MKEVAKIKMEKADVSIFSTIESFEHWQRVAKMISSSDIVPKAYHGNVSNTMIAIELANRIGISPFMVMQNLDVIQGRPSWNSTFIIAALNSCGRFSAIRFVFEGKEGTDEYGCRAVSKDSEGLILTGPLVNWKMVKDEGWLSKAGSKWKTMPELMFQYRAASFFGRLYAPDILKGMHSADETMDIIKPTQKENHSQQELERLNSHLDNCDTVDDVEILEESLSGQDVSETVAQAIAAKKSELKLNLQ